VTFEETPKVWRDLMDKGKSFHTTDAEQLKVHLPNLDVAESRANKFWSSPTELIGITQVTSADR